MHYLLGSLSEVNARMLQKTCSCLSMDHMDQEEHRISGKQLVDLYQLMETDAKARCCGPVLDLPQLYKRPPAADLLSALSQLRVKPSTWDDTVDATKSVMDEQGVPKYLTSIVASSLAWIPDDNVREHIWEAASARLCERSGRSGALNTSTHISNLSLMRCSDSFCVSYFRHPSQRYDEGRLNHSS